MRRKYVTKLFLFLTLKQTSYALLLKKSWLVAFLNNFHDNRLVLVFNVIEFDSNITRDERREENGEEEKHVKRLTDIHLTYTFKLRNQNKNEKLNKESSIHDCPTCMITGICFLLK